jgi:hypothetical protein
VSSQTYSVAKLKLAIGSVQLAILPGDFDWRWTISVSNGNSFILDFANWPLPTANFFCFVKIELTRH